MGASTDAVAPVWSQSQEQKFGHWRTCYFQIRKPKWLQSYLRSRPLTRRWSYIKSGLNNQFSMLMQFAQIFARASLSCCNGFFNACTPAAHATSLCLSSVKDYTLSPRLPKLGFIFFLAPIVLLHACVMLFFLSYCIFCIGLQNALGQCHRVRHDTRRRVS